MTDSIFVLHCVVLTITLAIPIQNQLDQHQSVVENSAWLGDFIDPDGPAVPAGS